MTDFRIKINPCPDATVENSDVSYTNTVAANGLLILPDSQINVNGVDEGDVVSVKTIDVNLEDSVGAPVVPTSVGLVGNTLTIEVASGGGSYDLDLVDRFGNAFPTKQVTANATWDLRTLTPFDWADIFLTNATGSYTSGEQQAIIDAVDNWFTSGVWEKRRSIFLFTGKNAYDNSINLKYPFPNSNGIFVGSPTHNSNGVTFNASSLFYTFLNFGEYSEINQNWFFYSRTDSSLAGVACDMGQIVPLNSRIEMKGGGSNRCLLSSYGAINVVTPSPVRSDGGFHLDFRSGTNATILVRNGITGTPINQVTNGASRAISPICLGGYMSSGEFTVTGATSRNYAGCAIGLGLTNTQMQDDYTIWQQFQTDFNSRQV